MGQRGNFWLPFTFSNPPPTFLGILRHPHSNMQIPHPDPQVPFSLVLEADSSNYREMHQLGKSWTIWGGGMTWITKHLDILRLSSCLVLNFNGTFYILQSVLATWTSWLELPTFLKDTEKGFLPFACFKEVPIFYLTSTYLFSGIRRGKNRTNQVPMSREEQLHKDDCLGNSDC